MIEVIKPCPFCGSEAEIEYEENDFAVKDNWVKVQCTECGGNSGWYLLESQARTMWNKRC